MKNTKKLPNLKARPIHDAISIDDDIKDFRFYVLEGECIKCGSRPYSLVWYDFLVNKRDPSQNIMKTACMCCGNREIHFVNNIEMMKEDDPPAEN